MTSSETLWMLLRWAARMEKLPHAGNRQSCKAKEADVWEFR